MTNRILCPECMQLSEYQVINKPTTLTIRGEDITLSQVAVCRACGEEVGLAELDDATFSSAYAIYRARHGLLQPEHIKALRSKYGLGQKAFARLLGWGEVTLARYEGGSLQSQSHDQALRFAEDPAYVRQLLKANRDRLTERQTLELEARLDELSPQHEGLLAREDAAVYGTAVRRLQEMVVYFAAQPNTWRTKLNKLLFYADFLHVKRYGVAISGARYIHMQYGPVPADFYTLQASLVDGASIDERVTESGENMGTIFVANRPADLAMFSGDELQTLADVSRHFEGWTAKQIMEFSHRERGWAETGDRETIEYEYASDLQLQ